MTEKDSREQYIESVVEAACKHQPGDEPQSLSASEQAYLSASEDDRKKVARVDASLLWHALHDNVPGDVFTAVLSATPNASHSMYREPAWATNEHLSAGELDKAASTYEELALRAQIAAFELDEHSQRLRERARKLRCPEPLRWSTANLLEPGED
jgi:hypothetical protein